ncbi:MAG: DnaJ domain-containing protein [Deltaproteobacteria bacterium]|nr:DnaJ domain-containing protein [Deltaproteobacteria bacterium]
MALAGRSSAADERVPRLGPGVDPTSLPLTPAEGYLLSRVDGRTPWRVLREIGGLSPVEVDRCLERWLAEQVLVVEGAAGRRAARTPPAPAARTPEPPAAAGLAVDASLDLPAAVQERLLALAARLDAPYHEILGVPPDADRKALKRAYFALSKEFHPDRYFRKNLGAFQATLERVFKRIVEAYELLSDPMARAEIEKSLAAMAPPAAAAAGAEAAATPAAAPEPGKPAPPRRPHVFSVAERVRKERRQRAKRLFEAGMAAYAGGRWLEAAGGVRLAIAFDPWNAVYKEQFAEVQGKAHQERAKQHVKEAESALELRDYPVALRAFEEALHYRPGDVDLLRRAARLALQTGGDLRQAKEWALEAVEQEPRDAGGHKLLGTIYKAAGLTANARREFELASQLDPKDEEARAELRAAGGGLGALRWLGGKR